MDIVMVIVVCNTLSIAGIVALILRADQWRWDSIRLVMYAVTSVSFIVMLASFMIYTGDINRCVSAGGTFMQFQKESMCVMEKAK
jgi:hypothetical protein